MRPDSDLRRIVQSTRERAQALRGLAKEGRSSAEALMARARDLRARHSKLEVQEAETQAQAKPRVRNRFHSQRVKVLEQLRQSLSDLGTIRMTPEDDPELAELKEGIRKMIASTEAAISTNR